MIRIKFLNWKWISIIIVVIIATPIFVNKLMNTVAHKKFASKGVVIENDWIGFMGSFLGSLFAGILTLGGVILTIKEQRMESIIEKFPHRLRHLDKLYDFFNASNIRDIESNFNEGYFGLVNDVYENIARKKEDLIKDATEVNGYFYIEVKEIVKKSEEWFKKYPRIKTNKIFPKLTADEYLELKKQEYPKFVNELQDWLQKFDSMYETFVLEHHYVIEKRNKLSFRQVIKKSKNDIATFMKRHFRKS